MIISSRIVFIGRSDELYVVLICIKVQVSEFTKRHVINYSDINAYNFYIWGL